PPPAPPTLFVSPPPPPNIPPHPPPPPPHDRAHFDYLLPAFRDPRYITVDGKLFFAILNAEEIPHISQFIALWRQLAADHGLPGFHFVAMRMPSMHSAIEQLLAIGFDAVNNSNNAMWRAEKACRLNSLMLKRGLYFLSDRLNLPLQCFNYKSIIRWLCDDDDRRDDTYPTLLPGYDRSPRSGCRAQIYYNNTPELWGQHIDDVLEHIAHKSPEHRIVLLKSWNEWGEGNYIEPDTRYGTAYLDVLREKLK
ncbi:MAG: glycoside hydrolase family 99-like domain-containing protein, partial [Muribaculum sp.]|nr:glycoside hydrolase family 99-like domain-containing protein [Muribaculum sp.]